jgi:ribosome-associated protein
MSHEARVPDDELDFRASRSPGAGGQNVNKVSTRVEVLWDVSRARRLTDEERARVLARLAGRIDKHGVLRVVASDERSQHRNKEIAVARLRALVARALAVPRPRTPTKPSRSAKARRVEAKKRRGGIKVTRRRPEPDE